MKVAILIIAAELGCSPVAECLPSTCEALGPILHMIKKIVQSNGDGSQLL